MKRLFDLSVALFCIGSFFRSVQGIYADMQPGIIHYPENISSPDICWEWAQKTACDKNFSNGYWVGYSIKKMMNKNSFMGCCSHHNKDKISLYEMINGIEWEQASPQYTEDELLKQVVEKAFLNHEKRLHNSNILKEVALLFLFTGESDKMPSLKDIQISNMDLHVDLKNLPLIWLGNFNDNESIPFLHRMYSKSDYLKKKFMVAVAIHGSVKLVLPFLKEVLSDSDDHLRAEAAFWTGQHNDKESLQILKNTIKSDQSYKVRKKCVFAIAQLDLAEAEDELIRIAYHQKEDELRKEAIFWLSQKATQKVTAALKKIVFDDEETDLQKQAVFAISMLPKDECIPELIKIAQTHPNPEVRKAGIFWLGETNDPKAVDALVNIIKENL